MIRIIIAAYTNYSALVGERNANLHLCSNDTRPRRALRATCSITDTALTQHSRLGDTHQIAGKPSTYGPITHAQPVRTGFAFRPPRVLVLEPMSQPYGSHQAS